MKRLLLAVSLAAAAVAIASTAPFLTRNFLTGTTPTQMQASANRTSFLVQNLGPNPIWCQLGGDGGTLSADHGVRLESVNGSWGMPEREGWPVWCVAGTAQVDGGGTVFSESR